MKTFCPKVMTTLTGLPRVSNLLVISLYTGNVLLQTASMKKTPFSLMMMVVMAMMVLIMMMMMRRRKRTMMMMMRRRKRTMMTMRVLKIAMIMLLGCPIFHSSGHHDHLLDKC